MVLEDESEQRSSSTSGMSRMLHNDFATFNPNEEPIEHFFNGLESYFSINEIQSSKETLAETFKFRSRHQYNNESLSDFISDLKQLSIKCDFDNFLDRALRDQLVV
ncbi:hypothetical protein PR048_012298 [Dryococelus australis]|uniref:Retrotransposon gag domain-containing protein n=1 Tax=Dryococelus australis TaxID=614101 RepID=A0ABQ9HPL5_9NEOP|nr:hypothetical protein PR048_012298 [Dryococelus australis]